MYKEWVENKDYDRFDTIEAYFWIAQKEMMRVRGSVNKMAGHKPCLVLCTPVCRDTDSRECLIRKEWKQA